MARMKTTKEFYDKQHRCYRSPKKNCEFDADGDRVKVLIEAGVAEEIRTTTKKPESKTSE